MIYRIAVLFVFVGIAIVSLCMGQDESAGKKKQAAPDAEISDHEKIENLLVEVAQLRKELAAMKQKYDAHTHPLSNLKVAQLPGAIECDQTVAKWELGDIPRTYVDRVCKQYVPGKISVLVPDSKSVSTGQPRH